MRFSCSARVFLAFEEVGEEVQGVSGFFVSLLGQQELSRRRCGCRV